MEYKGSATRCYDGSDDDEWRGMMMTVANPNKKQQTMEASNDKNDASNARAPFL